MNRLDDLPEAALELWNTWRELDPGLWPSPRRGPCGQTLQVFEQSGLRPLLITAPIDARQLDAALLWRVAFEAIVLPVALGGRVAAYLRPVELGEADKLRSDQVLCADLKSFPERRDALLDELAWGQREKVFLRRGDMVPAVLGASVPATVCPLEDAAREEAKVLRRLRASGICRRELLRLLEVWNGQHRRRGRNVEAHQPIVRVITEGEDRLLRALRQADAGLRSRIHQLLAAAATPRSGPPRRTPPLTPNPPHP